MLQNHSLSELSQALKTKKISSTELTQFFLDRCTSHQSLNAFIRLTPEHALAQAAEADKAIAAGNASDLCGIPIAHKDIFCTKDITTTCGSNILNNFKPPYDATVVAQTNAHHMPLLGKANCDEFAMGSSNENSYYGCAHNPWHTDYVPGGSSGGSAVAVAARIAPIATGTDTGGSIRQPAAFCGITGLKPTYGSVSRYGMVAYASSFDQGGPMGRSAEDCAMLYDAIQGFDAKDSTSVDRDYKPTITQLNAAIKGKKIGIPRALMSEGLQPCIAEAIEKNLADLTDMGLELVDIDLPNIKLSLPAYYVLAPAEASSNLSRYDGVRYGQRCQDPKDLDDLYKRSRSEGFGDEVKRRIIVGTYALSAGYYDAYYIKAQKLRRMIADDFRQAFESVDVIYLPTTPNTAFKIGSINNDPVTMYLQDIFTIPVNLCGLPALNFPIGFDQGLPIGAQLIGNYFSEANLLNIAHQYQQTSDWHQQAPEEIQS